MLTLLKSVGAVASGLATIVLTVLALSVPTNVTQKASFQHMVWFAGLVALAGLIAVVICDFKLSAKRDGQFAQLLEAACPPINADLEQTLDDTSLSSTLTLTGNLNAAHHRKLRPAALELWQEMRNHHDSLAPEPTDEERWRMSQEFVGKFYRRLKEMKKRFENIPQLEGKVVGAGEILPLGETNIKRIISAFEREANQVPEDIPM